jgi:hypothetical protein
LVSSPLVARDFMADITERNVSPIYLISTYIFVFCIFGSRFTAQNKGGGIHVSILSVIYFFLRHVKPSTMFNRVSDKGA